MFHKTVQYWLDVTTDFNIILKTVQKACMIHSLKFLKHGKKGE